MPHYVTTSTIKYIPIAGLMNRKKMTVPITVQTASPVLCWNLWFTTWNRQWHILLSLDGNLRIEIVETFNHSDKSPTCCRNIRSDTKAQPVRMKAVFSTHLTIILPIFIVRNVVCILHLLHVFKCTQDQYDHGSKHYESWSNCSLLIRVHSLLPWAKVVWSSFEYMQM